MFSITNVHTCVFSSLTIVFLTATANIVYYDHHMYDLGVETVVHLKGLVHPKMNSVNIYTTSWNSNFQTNKTLILFTY